jgi:putative hydrolase of the HAD superfamily
MIDWNKIDTVLLDMDGTLLDLHFDNYFWREHVPLRFAEKHNTDIDKAREEVYDRYRNAQGTIDWYSVDYWTRELGLDIALLKEEVDHLILVHPHVIDFLDAVRKRGKRTVLVTNAHGKSLRLKMNRTQLGEHLDALVCAHDLGLPKEEVRFWERLRSIERFEPRRTLLVDDNPEVLSSARDYGIGHLLAVLQPDTRGPVREPRGFPAILSFSEIMPA